MRAQLQYFDGHNHQVVLLRDAITVGGRASAIRVRGSTVSRQHARIIEEGGRFWVEDLGGDGVWVNGAKGSKFDSSRDRGQGFTFKLGAFAPASYRLE